MYTDVVKYTTTRTTYGIKMYLKSAYGRKDYYNTYIYIYIYIYYTLFYLFIIITKHVDVWYANTKHSRVWQRYYIYSLFVMVIS
jgi:hypothetical protein